MIVRLRAPDSSTEKNLGKEFVYYTEDWSAKDWLGIPIDPFSEHIEGKYVECMTKPVLDERTGEHIDNAFAGVRDSYYIPFTKKNVDEIIANSAHSDKDSIKFYIKFGMEDSPDSSQVSTRNIFSYDEFVNWSWERLREYQYWPVDDLFNRPSKAKSATNLEFKPS
jgi:hypothetical protein